jgi:hypothetical protein
VGQEERLPIATDGFVVINGAFRFDGPDSEVPLPWVRATTEAGDDIPGQLRVLRTESYAEMAVVDLGWQSDEPLPIGTVVKLSWSETDEEANAGGAGNMPASVETVELEVVAEPTPLPKPTATLGDWVEMRHGVGKLVDCESFTSCGTELWQVPTEEVRLPAVDVSWQLPAISSVVAWEVWAETSAASDGKVSLTPGPRRPITRQRQGQSVHDIVAFADDAVEHCVVMVVKDLRTGEESRSKPKCQDPGEPTSTLVDHHLGNCDEPPTPESLSIWCLGLPDDERCKAIGQGGEGGQAGSGTSPPAGGKAGSGASAPVGGDAESGASADVAGPAVRDESDGGCNYGASPASFGFGAAALGCLLLLASQRRSGRRA